MIIPAKFKKTNVLRSKTRNLSRLVDTKKSEENKKKKPPTRLFLFVEVALKGTDPKEE